MEVLSYNVQTFQTKKTFQTFSLYSAVCIKSTVNRITIPLREEISDKDRVLPLQIVRITNFPIGVLVTILLPRAE